MIKIPNISGRAAFSAQAVIAFSLGRGRIVMPGKSVKAGCQGWAMPAEA